MPKRSAFDLWVISNMKRHGSLLVSPKSAFEAGYRLGVKAEKRNERRRLRRLRERILRYAPKHRAKYRIKWIKNSEKLT